MFSESTENWLLSSLNELKDNMLAKSVLEGTKAVLGRPLDLKWVELIFWIVIVKSLELSIDQLKQISLQGAHWVQGAIGWPGGEAGVGCRSNLGHSGSPRLLAVSGGVQEGARMGRVWQLNIPHHLGEDLDLVWRSKIYLKATKREFHSGQTN